MHFKRSVRLSKGFKYTIYRCLFKNSQNLTEGLRIALKGTSEAPNRERYGTYSGILSSDISMIR